MSTGWNWWDDTTRSWTFIDWTIGVPVGVGIVAFLVLLWRLFRRREENAPSGSERPYSPATSAAVSWSDRKLFEPVESSTSGEGDHGLPKIEPHQIPSVDSRDRVFGQLTPVLAELLPESAKRREALKKELKAAGFHTPHAWENLAAIRYVAMMLPLAFFGGLLIVVPVPLELPLLVLMAVFCGVGWAVPRLYVRSKAAARTAGIEQAMPDVLDMLNMCVSQGLTMQESLRLIADDLLAVYPHLARELRIVCEQADVGTMAHALRNFADRIDVPEVQSFASLMIQTERMGTSVSQALTEYSDNFREAHRQMADQKANNATFKLLFPTVLCLMPAVYMFLLGPAIIELSDFFYGGGRDVIDNGRNALEQLRQ